MFNFHSFENMAVAITPENMTKDDKIWWHDFTENKQENWARRRMGYTFSQWQEITFAKLMSQHDDMSDKTLSEVRATRLTPINPTCCNWFQAEPPCDIDNNVESDDANTYPMIWDYCHAKLQQADIWNFGSLKHGEREKMQNGHCFLLGFHGGSGLTHPEKSTKLGDPQLLIQPGPVTAPLAPRLWESTGLYSYIHTYIHTYIDT